MNDKMAEDNSSFFDELKQLLEGRKLPASVVEKVVESLRTNYILEVQGLKALLKDEKKLQDKYKFSDGVIYALRGYVEDQGNSLSLYVLFGLIMAVLLKVKYP